MLWPYVELEDSFGFGGCIPEGIVRSAVDPGRFVGVIERMETHAGETTTDPIAQVIGVGGTERVHQANCL